MNDLIERLEQATGPDRALDCEIATAVGYRERGGFWRGPDRDNSDPPLAACPLFTASIDAAVTLVPSGLRWLVRTHEGKPLHDGITGKGAKAFANVYAPEGGGPMCDAWARSSPAIALCMAALNARAALSSTLRDEQ